MEIDQSDDNLQDQAFNIGKELFTALAMVHLLYSSFIALKIYHEYYYVQMNINSLHYSN